MFSSTIFGQNSSTANTSVTNREPTGQEVLVQGAPDDTVSSLNFSPAALKEGCFLISTSWAGDVRCWQVDLNTGDTFAKAHKQHSAAGTAVLPILDSCWSSDGLQVFTAGCDNAVRMWNIQSDQIIQVASHDNAVKTVHFIQRPSYSCIMTGSWDKSLRFWDLRSPQPILNLTVPERVYSADVLGPMAVVCTADRGIHVYDLNQQPKHFKQIESPLKHQHRCVSIFNQSEPRGFAVGGIEGRISVNDVQKNDNFTFKCHRSSTTVDGYLEVYPVNGISFHPIHNTMLTIGADGQCCYWDKDSRSRIKAPELNKSSPLTTCDIDPSGVLLAYAEGYDWHKGHEGNDLSKKPQIYLRQVFEDMKQKQKT
ncbi:hypothetical protein GJ496_000544 [Pomphorhynchus laevis]|nr:hypothetical protein GJ496_000544 [Pomphorhynchus laevis]